MPRSLLRCALDLPDGYQPKARYALRMLLWPLGFDPVFVGSGEEAALAYGARPPSLGQAAPVLLPYDDSAAAFFSDRPALPTLRGRAPHPVLFACRDGAEDPIATAFFWLSGWQEHAIRTRDVHGRFPFSASLQAEHDLATLPVVDVLREQLAEQLACAGHPPRRAGWAGASWAACVTHDVDYLRKWRPGMVYRELGPYLAGNALKQPLSRRVWRLGRAGQQAAQGDPYRRALARMRAEMTARGGRATYFFKAGAHGPHDVAYALEGRYARRLLSALQAEGHAVGLHPSYHAHDHPAYLVAERARLAAVLGHPPETVRQHYLRFDPVVTPRLLAAAGFRVDSSLGFAEHEGFRHGTCQPFQLYDVVADRPLDLWEVPLALMESALFNRRHLGVEEAVGATERVLDVCRRFGGVAVLLWHNVLWDELDHPGWGRHFLRSLDAVAARGGAFVTIPEAAAAQRA